MLRLVVGGLTLAAIAACAGPEPGGGPSPPLATTSVGAGGTGGDAGGAGGTGGAAGGGGPLFTGDLRWSRAEGGLGPQEVTEAIPVGELIAAAGSDGDATTSTGRVAMFDAAGTELPGVSYTPVGAGHARVTALAAAGGGTVVVGGNYGGAALGDGINSLPVASAAIFMGGFTAATGSPVGSLWSLTSSNSIELGDLAVTGNDDVVLCGQFEGTLAVSNDVVGTGPHTFVARLSRNGDPQWVRNLGPLADGVPFRCTVDVADTSVTRVWWSFAGSITVTDGQGNDVAAMANRDGAAGLLTLDDGGRPISIVTIDNAPGAGGQGEVVGAYDFAVDPCGEVACDVIVAGSFTGTLTSGETSAGQYDAFLARIDPSGAVQWLRQYGDALSESLEGIAIAPNHDLLLAGFHLGNIDLGGGVLTAPNGQSGMFVARLEANGDHRWSHGFVAGDLTRAYDVQLSPDGAVLMAGTFTGDLTLETTHANPSDAFVDRDAFVATFDP